MPTIPYKNKAGKRVKGTTTIIGQNIGWGKGGLLYWANQQGLNGYSLNEARDTATIPGTIAHYLIECYLKNVESDLSNYSQENIAKAQAAYNNFLKWTKQFKFKPLLIEPNLVSEYYQYGGTPDIIGEANDELCIIDWKTGKIYANTICQLAAYRQLAEENNCGHIHGFHILRIPRDEEIPSFHHSYWGKLPDEAWTAFTYALKLSKCEQVLKKLL